MPLGQIFVSSVFSIGIRSDSLVVHCCSSISGAAIFNFKTLQTKKTFEYNEGKQKLNISRHASIQQCFACAEETLLAKLWRKCFMR